MRAKKSAEQKILDAMGYQDRQKLGAALEAAQDYPILPTSIVDATPVLPEDDCHKLTPQQRLAVAALVAGKSFSEAARAASCCRKTLFDWRQQPAFQAAVERISREAMDVAVVRVRNMMMRATRILSEAMLKPSSAVDNAFRIVSSSKLWATADRMPTSVAFNPSDAASEPTASDEATTTERPAEGTSVVETAAPEPGMAVDGPVSGDVGTSETGLDSAVA